MPLIASSGSASGITVSGGAPVTIAYTVGGTATPPASWTVAGTIPPGLNFSGLTAPGVVNVDTADPPVLVLSGTPTIPGSYALTLQAWEGENGTEVGSPVYSYQLVVLSGSSNAPSFTTQPQDETATVGQTAVFAAAAAGATTYQWQFDGQNIAGATGPSLTLTDVQPAMAGTYSVIATNAGGSAFSRNASLTVLNAANAPVFLAQPVPQTVTAGSTVVFSASASATPAPTLQWFFNGAAVPGATGPTLVLTGVSAANAGLYNCVATNSGGMTASTQANLSLVATGSPGRLINLSVNAVAGNSRILTVGFVAGGAATLGTQALLIRATGPALAAFGVSGVLPDPTLTVFRGSTAIAANDNWDAPVANGAAVTAADIALGAFPLTDPASLDAALVATLPEGAYTVQVSGNGGASGAALAEVYDATAPGAYTLATPRLINVSCNTAVAAGASLTAGFVVGGTTSRTILVRAVGPTLAAFGVPGAMPDPTLTIHHAVNGQDSVLASNAGWGGDPQIAAIMTEVGAFPLPPGSADSVILATYAPGLYDAVAASATGAPGVALVEVYEVP